MAGTFDDAVSKELKALQNEVQSDKQDKTHLDKFIAAIKTAEASGNIDPNVLHAAAAQELVNLGFPTPYAVEGVDKNAIRLKDSAGKEYLVDKHGHLHDKREKHPKEEDSWSAERQKARASLAAEIPTGKRKVQKGDVIWDMAEAHWKYANQSDNPHDSQINDELENILKLNPKITRESAVNLQPGTIVWLDAAAKAKAEAKPGGAQGEVAAVPSGSEARKPGQADHVSSTLAGTRQPKAETPIPSQAINRLPEAKAAIPGNQTPPPDIAHTQTRPLTDSQKPQLAFPEMMVGVNYIGPKIKGVGYENGVFVALEPPVNDPNDAQWVVIARKDQSPMYVYKKLNDGHFVQVDPNNTDKAIANQTGFFFKVNFDGSVVVSSHLASDRNQAQVLKIDRDGKDSCSSGTI